ncbi:hypothetical protein BVI1335_2840004 [Burkholderia vietnamiensis]|nr:hypothetical protein BVI1335_2840004 [Burkholderia vietnamiensis]
MRRRRHERRHRSMLRLRVSEISATHRAVHDKDGEPSVIKVKQAFDNGAGGACSTAGPGIGTT